MGQGGEVGVGEAGDGVAHEGVSTGSPVIAEFLHGMDQVIDALFGEARHLLLAGKVG